MKRIITFILAIGLFTITIQAKEVYLGGDSIGIQVNYEGLLITSTYTIKKDNLSYNPNDSDIRKGDTIQAINGQNVETINDLNQILESVNDSQVTLQLQRNDRTIYRNLNIIYEKDMVKTGLFVKDEIMGIGTLTFIDPENDRFASLGHEIVDQETKKVILLDKGYLFQSNVHHIQKAQISRVGEKQALIHFDETIGNISKINRFGVFGNSYKSNKKHLIDTSTQDEIQEGKAMMYTVLHDTKIEEIEIVITKTFKQTHPEIKSFEFKIIDQNTLNQTNGIVQGMSGSPIVQNDKLIGAVTHVSSKNPEYGYGVYIEWMLNEVEE